MSGNSLTTLRSMKWLQDNLIIIFSFIILGIFIFGGLFLYNHFNPVHSVYADKVEVLYHTCDKDSNVPLCKEAVTALLEQNKKECNSNLECMRSKIDLFLASNPLIKD